MGVGSQRHAPTALHPGKTQYPLYRRLGGPQGRSGWVRKISPPPGFDPRTVQTVQDLRQPSECRLEALPAEATYSIFRGKFRILSFDEEVNCGLKSKNIQTLIM